MSELQLLTILILKGLIAAGSFVIPAGHRIMSVDVFNNTGNIMTGGLKFGTTGGGVDVVAAQAVAANANLAIVDTAVLKRFFSKTADQTISYDAVVGWNSTNIDLYITLIRVA